MGALGRGRGGMPVAGRRGRLALPLLACLGALAFATPAWATFHEMSIREVYPGGPNNASYVELQMWAAGQNFVGTHRLVAYNSDGSVNEDFKLPANVANGANQSTILVADTEYPVVFDEKPLPDASDEKLNLSSAGGAVCWIEGSPPDCVAWGDFKGPLPAHVPALKAGNPASPSGVSAGKALQRSIAKGCPTLLDAPSTDDSDDSATDFSEVEPNPRNNATPVVEHICPPIPNTVIDTKPANPTKATSASFTYHAVPATEASFECRLDADPFASCPSGGKEYPGPLAESSHTFQVRAVNPTGTDATPASYAWTVSTAKDEIPPVTTISSAPPNPSSSSAASFTYESSETESSFECAFDGAAFAACPVAGITYTGLGDGLHTFEVRAIDLSSNVDPTPASYGFAVLLPVVSLPLPTLPAIAIPAPAGPSTPETIVTAKPAGKTHDRTPTFRFRSATAGATFQCKLDRGPFRACRSPFTTKTLTFGHHTLKVRAISADIADPSPAVLRFEVERR